MKVICKRNKATKSDLKEDNTIFLIGHRYGLTLEKTYTVMGIRINKDSNCLYYLIDENNRPNWYPYMLLQILSNRIPKDWFVNIFNKNDNSDLLYLMGFHELCNDENFHDLLMEREEQAMQTYFRRKIELEEEYENNF